MSQPTLITYSYVANTKLHTTTFHTRQITYSSVQTKLITRNYVSNNTDYAQLCFKRNWLHIAMFPTRLVTNMNTRKYVPNKPDCT